MVRRKNWLIRSAIVLAVVTIPGDTPHFERPDVVYYTNELTTYPIAYRDNKPAPADIQGQVLLRGPIKALTVAVRNEGDRSAAACVRIPLSQPDEYLGGWITESEHPASGYMLVPRAGCRRYNLRPGDEVTFYLSLGNLSSDLAARIQVFNGDGSRAADYPYVALRDRSGIYDFGLVLILLFGVSRMRRPKQPAPPSDGQTPTDAPEPLSASSLHSTAPDQGIRERPPRDGTAGGG